MLAWLQTLSIFEEERLERLELLPIQGHCNSSYLLQSDKGRYLVRKFRLANRDREKEYAIQKRVARRDIGATPLLLDTNKAIMIAHFIEGEVKEQLSRKEIRALAILLRRLHRTPTAKKPLTFKLSEKKLLGSTRFFPGENLLCHNDMKRQNTIFSKQVRLIDWEYAGVWDGYFDIASTIKEFGFSRYEEGIFLESYFAHKSFSKQKLKAYKALYHRFYKAWFSQYNEGKLPLYWVGSSCSKV